MLWLIYPFHQTLDEGLVVTAFSSRTLVMGPPLFLKITIFTDWVNSFYLVLSLMKNNQLFFHLQQLYPIKTVKIGILLTYKVSMPFKSVFLDPFLTYFYNSVADFSQTLSFSNAEF